MKLSLIVQASILSTLASALVVPEDINLQKRQPEPADSPLKAAAQIGGAGLGLLGFFAGASVVASHLRGGRQSSASVASAAASSLSVAQFQSTFVRPTVTLTESDQQSTSSNKFKTVVGQEVTTNGQTIFIAQQTPPPN